MLNLRLTLYMKSFSRKVLILLGFATLLTFAPSCSKKVGCPVNQNVHVQTTKKGKVKGKAKSGLYTRKMTKKKRSRKKNR